MTVDEPSTSTTLPKPMEEPMFVKLSNSTPVNKPMPQNRILTELTNLSKQIEDPKSKISANWQYSLYNILIEALSTNDVDEFNRNWTTVLNFLHEKRNTRFSINYILSPNEGWLGSDMESSNYRRLLWLATETAMPHLRKSGARTIMLSKMSEGLSELAYNNLLSYYS